MRIQHNIMAMNAYTQYNKNTKALASNLEKLSSGYKINRAGDDAAGLAISEKMRAQITALDAAQKNVKDGTSLVKTAEGAMQEIHDMLNKMEYLATQSANGTYQDEVDRENLQKEVQSLKTEINRIADSSNFNGIKLLDGSLDENADVSTKVEFSAGKNGNLPAVGTVLGTDTVLHRDPSGATGGTSFSVDLHNVAVANGDTIKIKIGNTELEYTNGSGGDLTGTALVNDIIGDAAVKVDGTTVAAAGKLQINGQDVTMTAGTDGSGRLVFTQDNAPTQASEEIDPAMSVNITGDFSITEPSAASTDVQELSAYTPSAAATWQNGDTIKVGNTTYTVAGTTDLANNRIAAADITAAQIAQWVADEYNNTAGVEYTAAADTATGKVTFTANKAGAVGGDGPSVAPTVPTVTATSANTGSITNGALSVSTAGADVGAGTPTITTGIADYNVSTTDPNKVTAAGSSRLASTHFQLTEKMVEEGAKIKIGSAEYEFGTDVKIDDLNPKDSNYLEQVAQRLADAAGANTTYTVGHDGTRLTFTEIEGQTAFDLSTLEGVEQSFGFTGAAKTGAALTLQIGEDSEDYNQMSVGIGDMHVSAMGTEGGMSIEDIDIGTQQGAQAAVSVIKDAINYVSSVRGDLGALQNRLDHTSNNLATMQENIQDAESTIRDTDVANEMMKYVKNNILIQSSQAMLAQANQVPQGVLQLLG